MSQCFTYSIPPHALSFPATADRICVAEPRPHTYGEIIRADTRDTRRWMVNPLTGITPAHRTSLGYYRYVSPNGDNIWDRIYTGAFGPKPTANYSLLSMTVNEKRTKIMLQIRKNVIFAVGYS